MSKTEKRLGQILPHRENGSRCVIVYKVLWDGEKEVDSYGYRRNEIKAVPLSQQALEQVVMKFKVQQS